MVNFHLPEEGDRADFLAIGAHPDDVELGCGGTVIDLVQRGYQGAVLDLTRAELSTFGNPMSRALEAKKAAEIMGVKRYSLGVQEGAIYPNPDALRLLVSVIRTLQPRLLLTLYFSDRHPDHAATGKLTEEAVFWSGVKNYHPHLPPHRPRRCLFYFAHWEGPPTLIVDVSHTWAQKMEAVRCYQSQFEVDSPHNPLTYVGRPGFLQRVESRARYYGYLIDAQYGEPFFCRYMNKVEDLMAWTLYQGDRG